eukprot:1160944-Pelagomonas_calceolata.AAC.10
MLAGISPHGPLNFSPHLISLNTYITSSPTRTPHLVPPPQRCARTTLKPFLQSSCWRLRYRCCLCPLVRWLSAGSSSRACAPSLPCNLVRNAHNGLIWSMDMGTNCNQPAMTLGQQIYAWGAARRSALYHPGRVRTWLGLRCIFKVLDSGPQHIAHHIVLCWSTLQTASPYTCNTQMLFQVICTSTLFVSPRGNGNNKEHNDNYKEHNDNYKEHNDNYKEYDNHHEGHNDNYKGHNGDSREPLQLKGPQASQKQNGEAPRQGANIRALEEAMCLPALGTFSKPHPSTRTGLRSFDH